MGNVMGMTPQIGQAMEEFRKNSIKLQGMPLLQNVSFGMSGTGMPQTTGTGSQAQASQPASQQQQAQDQGTVPATPKEAISKSLGGMFGGFGKKKKQQDQQPQQPPAQESTSASGAAPPNTQPVTMSNSMMDMTIEVTSFSSSALDPSLFDIPAGYTQVQQNPDEVFGGKRR